MNKLTILLFLEQRSDKTKLSIESIRKFSKEMDIVDVFLVDHEENGLPWDWGMEQSDVTNVFFDEENISFGKMVNQIVEHFKIDSDVLFMNEGMLLTPGCVLDLVNGLRIEENIGAIGPVSNGFSGYQKSEDASDYGELSNVYMDKTERCIKQVLGLNESFFILKKECIKDVGLFDESFESQKACIEDYQLRLSKNNWKLLVSLSAAVWGLNTFRKDFEKQDGDRFLMEQKWGMHYFNTTYNLNLINCIRNETSDEISVLEVGCDCGATLLEISNRFPNSKVYGCELNPSATQIAQRYARVITANIEDKNLPYENEMFDYIILGDVLEHLRDPLSTIVYCKQLLKQNGKILASIPNVMNISVIQNLLNGNFTYTETGLLDKTHIHLFTYKEILRMFFSAHYQVDEVRMVTSNCDADQNLLIDKLLQLEKGAERFMYEAFQYVVIATSL